MNACCETKQMELDFTKEAGQKNGIEKRKLHPVIEKIMNIKIDYTVNISQKDRKYCKKHETAFKNALEYYNSLIETIEKNDFKSHKEDFDGYDPYFPDGYNDCQADKFFEAKKNIINKFIDNITGYFRSEYNLKIDNPPQEYYRENITAGDLIEYIVKKLNGKSLMSVKEKEYKNDLKKNFYNNFTKRPYIEVKNRKLIIKNFLFIRNNFNIRYNGSFSFHNHTGYYNHVHALNNCLAFFTKRDISNFELWGDYNHIDDFYKKHVTGTLKNNDRVLSIRFYKNEKAEIEFDSDDSAHEFLEFTGYSEHMNKQNIYGGETECMI